MSEFILNFNLESYQKLDDFALLTCQSYNFGNDSDWFGSFRGGLYGSYARIHGICTHYNAVHAWMPRPRYPSETEYHLASLFFNMDSFVECITFALNALGFCASGDRQFRNVTDEKSLKRISPGDILGRPNSNPSQPHLAEYDTYFPEFRKYWHQKVDLINSIFEQHDVSKHRETIFVGGKCRSHPPLGFYESIGIDSTNSAQSALFWPMEEIILKKDPKMPKKDRLPQQREDHVLLENLVPEFQEFVEKTGELAILDANSNINLKVSHLRKT